MIEPKDVTITIPHLGGTKESRFSLYQCLLSLHETAPEMKKIVVVNGHLFHEDFQLLDEGTDLIVENVTFMTLEEQGQCKAVNAAVATTNTPYIFITNDDMVYAPGWFEQLLKPYYPFMPVCVSPKLVEPRPGAPTFEVFFAGGAGGDFDKEKWLGYAEEHTDHTYDLQTGFNLPFLMDRRLWDTVGGYDINYDPWGSNSDSDLEYKIKLAGVQPMQNPNCVVYHFSQTSGTFEPRNDSHRFKNYAYFKEKFGFDRTDEGIWEANFHIPTQEEGRIFFPEWEAKYGKVY